MNDAWNFAIGLAQVDGGQPSPDFLELVKSEIQGDITIDSIIKALKQKYTEA